MENTIQIESQIENQKYIDDLNSDDVVVRLTTIMKILDTPNISLIGTKYKELMRDQKNEWLMLYLKHANKSNLDTLDRKPHDLSPMMINIPEVYRKKCICKNEVYIENYMKEKTYSEHPFKSGETYDYFVMFPEPNVNLCGDSNVHTHWVNTNKGWFRFDEDKFNFHFTINE